jgi:hypothetical protein
MTNFIFILTKGDITMPNIWWPFRERIQGAPSIDVDRVVLGGCSRLMRDEGQTHQESDPRAKPD